jgi:hypothetical protein
MYFDLMALHCRLKHDEERFVVAVFPKDGAMVVPSLSHVQADAWNADSRWSRHEAKQSKTRSQLDDAERLDFMRPARSGIAITANTVSHVITKSAK